LVLLHSKEISESSKTRKQAEQQASQTHRNADKRIEFERNDDLSSKHMYRKRIISTGHQATSVTSWVSCGDGQAHRIDQRHQRAFLENKLNSTYRHATSLCRLFNDMGCTRLLLKELGNIPDDPRLPESLMRSFFSQDLLLQHLDHGRCARTLLYQQIISKF
jgi:hypothetical protein